MEKKVKKESRFPRLRAASSAAALTLCLLLMVVGFLVADYNTRRIGTGESSLRIDAAVQNNQITVDILGHERSVELPKSVQEWTGRAWTLLSPEVRTVIWLYEAECDAIPQLSKWIGIK